MYKVAEVKVLRNKGEAAGVYSRDAVMKSLWYPTENICFLLDCIVPRNWTFGGHNWMTHDCNNKCCQVTTTVPSFPADFCCRDVVVNGIQRRPFCPAPAEDSHTIDYIIKHHENNPDYVSIMPTTGMTKVCGTRAYKWHSTANLDELQTACRGDLSLTSSNKYNWTGTAYAPEVYYQKGVSETRFGSSFSKSQSDYWAFTDSDHFADMFRPGGAYVDENDPTSLQEFFDTQDAHDLLDFGIQYNRVNLLNRAYPADKQYITNLDYAPLSCNATEAPNVYYDEGKLKIWIPAGSKYVTYTNDGDGTFTKGSVALMDSTTGEEDQLPTASDLSMTTFRIPCLPIADEPGDIQWLGCDGTDALPSSFDASALPYSHSYGCGAPSP
ncbi:hypothetical protein QOT17_010331 [Balamuthia mandrillaris]